MTTTTMMKWRMKMIRRWDVYFWIQMKHWFFFANTNAWEPQWMLPKWKSTHKLCAKRMDVSTKARESKKNERKESALCQLFLVSNSNSSFFIDTNSNWNGKTHRKPLLFILINTNRETLKTKATQFFFLRSLCLSRL